MKKQLMLCLIGLMSSLRILPVHAHTIERYENGIRVLSSSKYSEYGLFQTLCLLVLLSVVLLFFIIKILKRHHAGTKLINDMENPFVASDEDSLSERVEEMFYMMQDVSFTNELDRLKPYVTKRLLKEWENDTFGRVSQGKKILNNIKLIVNDMQSTNKAVVWFCIQGSIVADVVEEGEDVLPEHSTFIENWKLIREKDGYYLDEVQQKKSKK